MIQRSVALVILIGAIASLGGMGGCASRPLMADGPDVARVSDAYSQCMVPRPGSEMNGLGAIRFVEAAANECSYFLERLSKIVSAENGDDSRARDFAEGYIRGLRARVMRDLASRLSVVREGPGQLHPSLR